MELDEELCLCFHVTKRKVLNYLRVERPSRAGQLSDCFGAGTGCGWCRSYLCRLFDEARLEAGRLDAERQGSGRLDAEPTSADYARARAQYIRAGGGTPPPGATPPVPE